MVPAFPVLRLVVYHPPVDLNLAGGEIPLEVRRIILCIPQAELHR